MISPLNIELCRTPISRKTNVTFLGIQIDEKLKFDIHIANIAKKLSKNVGIFYKLRNILQLNTLKCLYHSFIESYINYCLLIYGNAYSSHLKPLEIVQKK